MIQAPPSPSVAARALIAVVGGYRRFISPWLPPLCRYQPSCSQYAIDALRLRGAWKGLLLTIWRLLRCHPFSRGGHDPVPPPRA